MQTITVTLTLQEAQMVLDALVELPFKRSADLIFKIQRQATEQTQETYSESRPQAVAPAEGEVNSDG